MKIFTVVFTNPKTGEVVPAETGLRFMPFMTTLPNRSAAEAALSKAVKAFLAGRGSAYLTQPNGPAPLSRILCAMENIDLTSYHLWKFDNYAPNKPFVSFMADASPITEEAPAEEAV